MPAHNRVIRTARSNPSRRPAELEKIPSGIRGLDEVTHGGLPKGRTALVYGGPGTGKTLLGLQFLLRGAQVYDEPGVCICFEETPDELVANVASLGYDLNALIKAKKLVVDNIQVDRRLIEETGDYDLEGLFIRLRHAIDQVKAKRVLLDTIEVLFLGLKNEAVIRAELRRLFHWLKDAGVTAVITAEQGEKQVTRYGLEEYVADCVIILDHRVNDQISTRRLRVLKFRGSSHETNEYPFLLDDEGITVIPITSLNLTHQASIDRVSSGISSLDEMLEGKGYYRGSSILLTGTAGTGKSSFGAAFVNAACARGERALYFAFEESPSQILRNMRSVGMNLEPWIKRGLLKISASRPSATGLEGHLALMHKEIEDFSPSMVVLDPVTNLVSAGDLMSVKAMLTRVIDYLKNRTITALFTNLVFVSEIDEQAIGISSLMDSWIVLRYLPNEAERTRTIHLLKSRGMAHDTQMHSFSLSEKGITIHGKTQTIRAAQAS
jgi:circadian clock protein KaiC